MYCFDVEIFPNFFSGVFSHIENEFDDYTFVIYGQRDDREKLREFVKGKTLIGYNNIHFDNLVLNAVISGYSLHQLYKLVQKIIEGNKQNEEIKKLTKYPTEYKSIDLMKIMAFDDKRVSLKQAAIQLKWPKIQELPFPPDEPIENNQVETLLIYNANDVGITKRLYWEIEKEVNLRQKISKLYEVDVTSASRSKTGSVILDKAYREKSGNNKFMGLRTQRNSVKLIDCIGKNINFKSKELNGLLNRVKSTTITSGDDYQDIVKYAGLTIKFAKGGLHSDDKGGIFETDDKMIVVDCDVTSFYPMIILNNSLCPAHLNKDYFLSIFRKIVNDRIEAKSKGDKVRAEALKIVVNAIFGKLKSEYYWLYDPLTFYSVTISGQLYLMSLIEKLNLAEFKIISANTDGIICYIERSRYDEYKSVCNKWMEYTGFGLDFSEYKSYVRRDVNNYIAIPLDPYKEIKRKGIFNKIEIDKGYATPIIRECVEKYIFENIPVKETLHSSNDIYDFVMSKKADKKFDVMFRNGHIEKMQRTNRFVASLDGGELYKIDEGKKISFCTNSPVTIVNDIIPFENCKINYLYYEQQINDIINEIKPLVTMEDIF
jgi:hypothetical protein